MKINSLEQPLERIEGTRDSSKAPFSGKCHYVTYLVVPWKTPLAKLSLFDLTWSSPSAVFPPEVLVENNQRQLFSKVVAEAVDNSEVNNRVTKQLKKKD